MKHIILTIIAVAVCGLCGAVDKDNTADDETGRNAAGAEALQGQAKEDIGQAVSANTAFALNLYAKLKGTKGNIFFSPYSISTVLSITCAGAASDTQKQMAGTLCITLPDQRHHQAAGALERQFARQAQKGDYQLWSANALWLQKGYSILKPFSDNATQNYLACLEELDFAGAAEQSRTTINNWVQEKTAGKITDLLPQGTITILTRLVITNAVYFKGLWTIPFNPQSTSDADFYISSVDKIKVPFMHKSGRFSYFEDEDVQVLSLGYKGGDLSMVILLPKQRDGLARLEKSLTVQNVKGWMEKVSQRASVIVDLPRFKMTCDFRLDKVLGEMGMPKAFSGAADFSGISGGKDLFISAVVHKAFVEVNEEGTEAAAATGAVMSLTSVPARPPVFMADHPFVFMITDTKTKSILFMGRVSDPSGK